MKKTNELTGATQAVYDALDSIGVRTKMPPLPAALSKEQLREKIRNECRIERAFEGLRYFDSKRWRIAPKALSGVNDGLVTRNSSVLKTICGRFRNRKCRSIKFGTISGL